MARGQGREALLRSASTLFASKGYERTTTRDIAEDAGVDATLIARYFGSKAGLYLAALRVELGEGPPTDLLQPARMTALLGRLEKRGAGPVFQSAVQAHEDPDVQEGAREALHARLVTPLVQRYLAAGMDRPQLHAELVTAAFAGVALGRGSGAFPALEQASIEELVAAVTELFAG